MFSHRMEVSQEQVLFVLCGQMGLEETALLRNAFRDAVVANLGKPLVLDMQEVTSIEASTISLFVGIKNFLEKNRGHLILTGMRKSIFHSFEKTNLHHYFNIRESL